MRWVNTGSITAQMVKFKPLWNRAMSQGIGHFVGYHVLCLCTRQAKQSIATNYPKTIPDPTFSGVSNSYQLPEPFAQGLCFTTRFMDNIWRAIFEHPTVMFLAHLPGRHFTETPFITTSHTTILTGI